MLTAISREKQFLKVLEDPIVLKIAKKHNKLASHVALRFLVQEGVAAIPKSVTTERIKENINIFDFELDARDMQELEELDVGEEGRVSDFKAFTG